jgi:hypothetical protein
MMPTIKDALKRPRRPGVGGAGGCPNGRPRRDIPPANLFAAGNFRALTFINETKLLAIMPCCRACQIVGDLGGRKAELPADGGSLRWFQHVWITG